MPSMQNLKTLDLHCMKFHPCKEIIEAIGSGLILTRLENLSLGSNAGYFGDFDMEKLIKAWEKSNGSKHIKQLDISTCGLTTRGINKLLTAIEAGLLPSLRVLHLGSLRYGARGRNTCSITDMLRLMNIAGKEMRSDRSYGEAFFLHRHPNKSTFNLDQDYHYFWNIRLKFTETFASLIRTWRPDRPWGAWYPEANLFYWGDVCQICKRLWQGALSQSEGKSFIGESRTDPAKNQVIYQPCNVLCFYLSFFGNQILKMTSYDFTTLEMRRGFETAMGSKLRLSPHWRSYNRICSFRLG